MDGARHSQIETHPIHVIITTADHEIEGYIHVKPGGYQSRVSDLLNVHDLQYLPVTDAVIRTLAQLHKEPRRVDTVILRLDVIKMVIPLDDEAPQNQPGPAPEPPPATPPQKPSGGAVDGNWGNYGGGPAGGRPGG